MASTIQLKTGTGSAVPSSLTQGEVGINIDNGLIYYGSGSGNDVKQLESFTHITASGNISSSGTVFASALDLEGANLTYNATHDILKFGDNVKLGIGAGPLAQSSDLTISSDGTDVLLVASVGKVTLNSTSGDTIIRNQGISKDIILQTDKNPGGQQGGQVLISGSNADVRLQVLGNITASGNISASGRIYGRQLEQIETNFGYDFDNGTFVYMPFSNQSTTENSAFTNTNVNRVAVVPGKPVKSIMRATGNTLGNNTPYTMSYWESAEGAATTPVFKAAVYAITDGSSNKDAVRFDWSSPNSGSTTDVAEGSRIYMSLESNNSANAGYIITHLWEWDYNNI